MHFSYTVDDEGLVVKSTRHTADTLYNNHLGNNPSGVTPSTILVHGLLGEVCLSDSDCSILNSVCSTSQRCTCQPGTQPNDDGKICKFVDRNVPPTVLVGKFLSTLVNDHCFCIKIFLICSGRQKKYKFVADLKI